MILLASVVAVALSLSNIDEYTYTRPACSSNQIVGIGMGATADYTLVRAEDVAFLREAYAERTAADFAVVNDRTNALDRPILARPYSCRINSAGSEIFADANWGGCFSLSYTTNEMPYCEGSTYPGSFVQPTFRFPQGVTASKPIDSFAGSDWAEFRDISTTPVAQGMTFATNLIPKSWWKAPFILSTNRLCTLYAALPLFNVAAQMLSTDSKTNRVAVYDVSNADASPTGYIYTTFTNESTGVGYTWATGYSGISSASDDYKATEQGLWYSGFSEYRQQGYRNYFSCARTSSGEGPFPLVPCGEYESFRREKTVAAVSNAYVWAVSPVPTNAQNGVEILQSVLAVRVRHDVTVRREWFNGSLPIGDPDRNVIESTNYVNCGVIYLPVVMSLDKSVGVVNYRPGGPRWLYKLDAPMYFIQRLAHTMFGDVDSYWPEPARVPNNVIADAGTAGGSAIGTTGVDLSTSFIIRVFVVCRRAYNAYVRDP